MSGSNPHGVNPAKAKLNSLSHKVVERNLVKVAAFYRDNESQMNRSQRRFNEKKARKEK